MSSAEALQSIINAATVVPEIYILRPDYRVLLVAASNITPGPSNPHTESLLSAAETHAKSLLASTPVTSLPHISAWREAYKSFGAKPNKTRNSLEALTRRVEKGLPRVNRLTDIYNAISVRTQIPFGGEDLDRYEGAPKLIVASGEEVFEVKEDGKVVRENVEKGEVVWCDDAGVTCRRWNWRQGPRTALTDQSTRVVFILDALEPCSDEVLIGAGEELERELKGLGEGVVVVSRLIGKEK